MNDELIYDVVLRLDPDSANKVAQEIEAIESVAGRLKSFDSEAQAAKKAEKAIQSKTEATRQSNREARESAKVAQSAGAAEENAIKSVTQEIRAQIDAIDLAQRQRRISADDALAQYGAIEKRLASLDQTNQQVITRQRQLFFASERARNGFVTLSTSMVDVQQNTKGASLALMNIGRVAQDLPFGLMGISNNIDPLLVSFRNLKMELGSTGLALRAILKLLGGPLGMIFLLGSILPSVILIAQNGIMGFGKKSKEALDSSGDAVKQFDENLKAAASSGVGAFVDSFVTANQQINAIEKSLNKLEGVANTTFSGMLYDQNSVEQSLRDLYNGQGAYNTAVADATKQLDPALIKQAEMAAQQEEISEAVREELMSRLAILKADQAIQAVLRENGLVISDEEKSLKAAREETQKRLQAERESLAIFRRRQDRRFADVSDMAKADVFDEFQVDVDPIVKTTQETWDRLRIANIQMMRDTHGDAFGIMEEQSIKLHQLGRNRLALGLADEEAYQLARRNIVMETEAKITEIQKREMENRREMYMMGADFAVASANVVFGETKGIAVAQTLIDTWRGAQGVFAQTNGGIFARSLAAGVAVATGLANVRKILTTQKNTKSAGGATSPTPLPQRSAPTTTFGVVDASSIAKSMGGAREAQAPTIVLTGDLDSEYLAVKVRRGNDAISSRGITVASV
jgi:hypothetical protein